MTETYDVAIIGAGPYGLSLAAHLRAQGLSFRIFGKPLDSWSAHMPKGMMLKSDGFASNLSAPEEGSTLKAYCAERGLAYGRQGVPVSLELFLAYANWFRARHVPELEETFVTALEGNASGFTLRLDNGEKTRARHVVLAVGITWFAYTPPVLAALPAEVLSHSFDHRDVSGFRGREVAVVGRGSSAVDLAWALHEAGATARIVTRSPNVEYNSVPREDAETLWRWLWHPLSGIGGGWRSLFCAQAPLLFHKLPQALRARAVTSHLHPAAGWFMRQKVEGRIPMTLGRDLVRAQMQGGRVRLTLADRTGGEEHVACDHVIAATGYRADLRRLPFLAPQLRERIVTREEAPVVSSNFETSVPGLFAVGFTAMNSFGPLMRFMVGAEFAAPRLAGHLARKAVRYRRNVRAKAKPAKSFAQRPALSQE